MKAFIDIHFGQMRNKKNGVVYASLYAADMAEGDPNALMINAELNYIIKAANERKITIVNLQGALGNILEYYDLSAKGGPK